MLKVVDGWGGRRVWQSAGGAACVHSGEFAVTVAGGAAMMSQEDQPAMQVPSATPRAEATTCTVEAIEDGRRHF